MNRALFTVTVIFPFVLSCNMNTQKDNEQLQIKEQQLYDKEKELTHIKDSIKSINNNSSIHKNQKLDHATKYVYIKIVTSEPSSHYNSDIGEQTTKWEFFDHCSNITEVENLTEDKKAKLLDGFMLSIKSGMKWTINRDGQSVGKIIDRKCLVFDSYSKASEDRYKNCGK